MGLNLETENSEIPEVLKTQKNFFSLAASRDMKWRETIVFISLTWYEMHTFHCRNSDVFDSEVLL